MPFQVFRRHQRKMMAALAIFAMVAFSLDFSLFRSQFSGGPQNTVVAELNGRRVYRSDVEEMKIERNRINRFISILANQPYQEHFGGIDTRSIVDALILEREADRLGIPADVELAKQWLRRETNPPLSTELFDRIYRQHFSGEVTEVGLLEELANQIRIRQVIFLPGMPVVTPLDLYSTFKDQNEQVSVTAVAFPVQDFMKDVPEPSEGEVRAFFDKYRDVLPDATSPTPGFKVPRRIQVEYVSADPLDLARSIQATLGDDELRKVFKERSADFPLPPPELPVNLFADDPEAKLTPGLRDEFEEMKDVVARVIAREKAQAEIDAKFGQIQDDALAVFSERYGDVLAVNEEAKAEKKPEQALPKPGDLFKEAAAKVNLPFERTPLMDRALAANYGQIGGARRGGGVLGGGVAFADVFFDSRQPLYAEIDLSDMLGRRFLAWKIADEPARVPKLDEPAVRAQVVEALKRSKARPLAEKAAQELAKKAEAENFDLAKAAGGRAVITTSPVPKMVSIPSFNPMQPPEPPRPSEITNIPEAGPTLRTALFGIEPKQAKVAPDLPENTFYVMTLKERFPTDLAGLFGTTGPRMSIQREVEADAVIERLRGWMQELRRRAGLKADWVPPDEAERERQES